MHRLIPIVALGLAVATGCGGVVERNLALEFQGTFPHASSNVVGDSLHAEVEHLPEPAAGLAYVVWVRGELGWVRLGPVSEEAPAAVDAADLGVTWDQFDELVIGLDSMSAPGEAPTREPVFRGPLSAALSFAGISPPADETLEAVSVPAHAEDRVLTVDGHDLPALDGATWQVWLVPHGDDLDTAFRLGRIEGGSGPTFETNGLVAGAEAVAITLDIDGAIGGITHERIVFLGPMLTEAEGEAPTPSHGGGEHTH